MSVEVQDAIAAMHARAVGDVPSDVDCHIDSRTITPGQTYLALRGEHFDGHAFVAQARAAGAVAAIVDNAESLGELAGFVVADTRIALMALASATREHFCGAVAAVTGSAGKTTTKDFLAQLLTKLTGNAVAASPANENNEIGVSKLLLRLRDQAAAVVEMGARHYGDIAPLAAIARPQVAVLTNIGDAHLEIFATRERLAETKWQIFGTGAKAVISFADDIALDRSATLRELPWLVGLRAERAAVHIPVHCAGVLSVDRTSLLLERKDQAPQEIAFAPTVDGEHNLRNVASACGAALALGFSLERIAAAAHALALPHGRYEKLAASGGAVVIHDAYNASPSGTVASVEAFSREVAARHLVVFGSMAELGADAVREHERVAVTIARRQPDLVFFGGEYAAELEAAAVAAGLAPERVARFTSNGELIERLRGVLRSGDMVLVKGSRKYRLEEVVHGLTQMMEAAR